MKVKILLVLFYAIILYNDCINAAMSMGKGGGSGGGGGGIKKPLNIEIRRMGTLSS